MLFSASGAPELMQPAVLLRGTPGRSGELWHRSFVLPQERILLLSNTSLAKKYPLREERGITLTKQLAFIGSPTTGWVQLRLSPADVPFTCPWLANRRHEDEEEQQQQQQDDDEDEDDDDEDEEERSLRTALQELRVDAARCERTAGGPAGLSRHGRSGSPVLYPPTFTHCGTKHKTRSHTPKTHVRSSVCATAEHGTEDRHSPHFEASHGRRATAEPLLNHRCGACGEVTGELPRSALIVSL